MRHLQRTLPFASCSYTLQTDEERRFIPPCCTLIHDVGGGCRRLRTGRPSLKLPSTRSVIASFRVRWLPKHSKAFPPVCTWHFPDIRTLGHVHFCFFSVTLTRKYILMIGKNRESMVLKIHLFIYRRGLYPSLEENRGYIVLRRLDSWHIDMIVIFRSQHRRIHIRALWPHESELVYDRKWIWGNNFNVKYSAFT